MMKRMIMLVVVVMKTTIILLVVVMTTMTKKINQYKNHSFSPVRHKQGLQYTIHIACVSQVV